MQDHLANNPNGVTDNYEDLARFLEYNPDSREFLGLGPNDDIDDWLVLWGSNK